MPDYSNWSVTLNISGKIKVPRSMTVEVEKGSVNPFWTAVRIESAPHGVSLQVDVHAHDEASADDAALFFVGQTLDLLALRINMPLYLSLANAEGRKLDVHAKRLVTRDEWSEAFALGRDYGIERPIFARGLSWYRKGLNSEDSIDKFLAFQAAIQGISARFAERNERTNRGAINQICNCLDQLWRDRSTWKVIRDDPSQINHFQEIRNRISHGGISVDVDSVRSVSIEIPKLQELVRTFLVDWETMKVGSEPRKLIESEDEFTE